jgi:DUF4097 and DUF4098 domain-containing protein YvlB
MRLGSLLAAVGLAIVGAGSGLADDWTHSYPVSGTPDLRIETNDGAVIVRGSQQKTVEARVTTTGWKIAPGEVVVHEHQTGDSVTLEVKIPNHHWNVGNRSLKIEVSAPENAKLNVRTGDGSVRISNVQGEVRVNTGDGGIDADGVAGVFEASTGDGHIRVAGRFDSLYLHTGDGSVEADTAAGSKVAGRWQLETGDGHVTLNVPKDLAADLEAKTGDGHISVDMPLTLTAGKVEEHHIRGRLNGGGQPISIKTGDGGIKIAQR